MHAAISLVSTMHCIGFRKTGKLANCVWKHNKNLYGNQLSNMIYYFYGGNNAYYTITASSEFREKERLRAKARHDEARALHNARREEKFEIARNMKADGEPVEKIMRYTGLTAKAIEDL